jgi:hypothetical protein
LNAKSAKVAAKVAKGRPSLRSFAKTSASFVFKSSVPECVSSVHFGGLTQPLTFKILSGLGTL